MSQCMNDAWTTALATLASGLLGGWIGAVLQAWYQRRLHRAELFWEIRTKLIEIEQSVWSENWVQFQAYCKWLEVASSDPRVQLDQKQVKAFLAIAKRAWRDRQDQLELYDKPGIAVVLLQALKHARMKLDQQLCDRIRRSGL